MFPRDRLYRHAGRLAGGSAVGQLVLVVASPILTRIYSPGDFGALAVFTGVLVLVAVVASLRLEPAIVLPEHDRDADALVAACLAAIVLVGGLTAGLLVPTSAWIANRTGMPSVRGLLALAAPGVVLIGIYQVGTYRALRQGKLGRLAGSKVASGCATVAAQIGMGLAHAGPLGLAVGQIAGFAAGSLLLFSGASGLPQWPGLRRIAQVLRRYRRFPLLSSWSAVLNSAALHLPLVLLAGAYGPAVAGWFALAQRVVGSPMNLLATSVSQAYVVEISERLHRAPGEIEAVLRSTVSRQFGLGLVTMIVAAVAAPWLFPWVFGSEWAEAGRYVTALALPVLAQFVAVPVGGTLDVLERQGLQLLREGFRLMLTVGAVLTAAAADVGPRAAVVLLSVAGTAGYGFALFLAWRGARAVAGRAPRRRAPEANR